MWFNANKFYTLMVCNGRVRSPSNPPHQHQSAAEGFGGADAIEQCLKETIRLGYPKNALEIDCGQLDFLSVTLTPHIMVIHTQG